MNKTLIQAACMLTVATSLGSSYLFGYRKAAAQGKTELAALQAKYTAAALAAEREYTAALQQAAAEKQRWQDFAAEQSSKLAAANKKLDVQTALLNKEINHAVQQDNHKHTDGFNGIGPDSVQIYNRAIGYSD